MFGSFAIKTLKIADSVVIRDKWELNDWLNIFFRKSLSYFDLSSGAIDVDHFNLLIY